MAVDEDCSCIYFRIPFSHDDGAALRKLVNLILLKPRLDVKLVVTSFYVIITTVRQMLYKLR